MEITTNGDAINGQGIKVDTSKYQRKFSQNSVEDECLCTICGKHVYHMEKVKAEKRLYHKTCFRCIECNKSLSVDSYQSHEGDLFCHIHFKLLFQPKAKFENDDQVPRSHPHVKYSSLNSDFHCGGKQRRNEMIIRENIPTELPPDVVRSEAKLEDGLENYQLDLGNIRQRFESGSDERSNTPLSLSDTNALKRSESILARLQRYQTAISGERNMSLNGEEKDLNGEGGGTSESDQDDNETETKDIIKESKKKEKLVFAEMSSLKNKWESGSVGSRNVDGEEGHEYSSDETKEHLYRLRQRICVGRSASLRQVYERVHEEKATPRSDASLNIESSVKAVSLKEKFEKGQIGNEEEAEDSRLYRLKKEKEEDLSVVAEAETAAREAKNIFKRMDAGLGKSATMGNLPSSINGHNAGVNRRFSKDSNIVGDVVKCSDPTVKEEVMVENATLQERFKFFECYKNVGSPEPKRFEMTPPREQVVKEDSPDPVQVERDPNIIRSSDTVEDFPKTDTAKKMLSKFKQMENTESGEVVGDLKPIGPKPLKRITPPREFHPVNDEDDKEPTPPRDPTIVRSSYKTEDVVPVEPEKAKSLKAKFENWKSQDERDGDLVNGEGHQRKGHHHKLEVDDGAPQSDTTKNLRAMFESIKEDNVKVAQERPKLRVNRFVNDMNAINLNDVGCSICTKRIYPMEKLEFSGLKMHKNCFKCTYCHSSLRLDNYTLAAGKLYCLAHFKQLFMSKGNYDEGFGQEQHKEKWTKHSKVESDYVVCDANDNPVILDQIEA